MILTSWQTPDAMCWSVRGVECILTRAEALRSHEVATTTAARKVSALVWLSMPGHE